MKQPRRKLVILYIAFVIGTLMIIPSYAQTEKQKSITIKAKESRNASQQWTSKNFYPKKTVKKYWYSKKQSNSRYYTKTSVNSLIANYLTTTAAASTYLTLSSASDTYLTQASAGSTYLPLSGGTLSGSLTATDYTYSSATNRSLSVNGTAFQPLSDLVLDRSGTNLGVYRTSGSATSAYFSVNLPNGAIVTGVTTYYYDNDNTGAWLQVQLIRDSLSTVSQVTMTDSGSLGSGTLNSSSPDSSVDYSTIDNDTYNYQLKAVLSSSNANCTFRSVKINYTVVMP